MATVFGARRSGVPMVSICGLYVETAGKDVTSSLGNLHSPSGVRHAIGLKMAPWDTSEHQGEK
jgi:hypothetical protein